MASAWYLIVLVANLASAAVITVDKSDGGYKDVVVGIDPSVAPNEDIITNIKALFQSSSKFLHRATDGRVYFKQVTIVIPKTWPDRANVQWTSTNLYDSSDIRIDRPNPQYNDTPYTIQPRGCGERGDYVHLTPNFLINLNGSTTHDFGDPAYHLVHEWAHLRTASSMSMEPLATRNSPVSTATGTRFLQTAALDLSIYCSPQIKDSARCMPTAKYPITAFLPSSATQERHRSCLCQTEDR